MNKSDVIAAMADRAGMSNKDAGACLDAFFDVVADAVAAGGDKVSIPGWISFEQVHRAARTARNPQTGEPVQVQAAARTVARHGGGAAEAPPAAPSW